MKPVDPRLLRRSRPARVFLAAGAALALLQTAAIATFAWSLATIVTVLLDGGTLDAATGPLSMFAAAVIVRAAAVWAWESVGTAGAMRVKTGLRAEILTSLARTAGTRHTSASRVSTVVGPGLDALDEYFSRYLPQLLLTIIATPVLIALAWIADPLSGLTFVIVLPLVPIFMALIGLATRTVQERQWASLQHLSKAFLELIGGLGTLVLFGRAARQRERIAHVTEEYRARTMRVLRVTFLSGFTLELAASLSVALVAVSIGLRLVSGDMSFLPGLFVLLLAPEIFLPLRNVGTAFHASAGGVEAARDAFDLLDASAPESTPSARDSGALDGSSSTAGSGVELHDVTVFRAGTPVLDGVQLVARAGEVTAIIGSSGSGKSSLVAALLGFADATGSMTFDGRECRGERLREHIAWSGQSTALLEGTIASNVRLGHPDAAPELLARALVLAGVELPAERTVPPGGTGLSGGQAQRVATARAIHRLLASDLPVLVLDEPSSALDLKNERQLATNLRQIAATGVVVIVATHRAALMEAADRIVDLERAHV